MPTALRIKEVSLHLGNFHSNQRHRRRRLRRRRRCRCRHCVKSFVIVVVVVVVFVVVIDNITNDCDDGNSPRAFCRRRRTGSSQKDNALTTTLLPPVVVVVLIVSSVVLVVGRVLPPHRLLIVSLSVAFLVFVVDGRTVLPLISGVVLCCETVSHAPLCYTRDLLTVSLFLLCCVCLWPLPPSCADAAYCKPQPLT